MIDPNMNKPIKIPHTYVIIFTCILLAALATWVLPGGSYEKVKHAATGRMIVDPSSFKYIDAYRVGLMDVLKAFPKGFQAASEIIGFLFLIAASFRVIEVTGAINASVFKAIRFFGGRGHLLIPASMLLFSVCGFMFGMSEETIIFVPIGVAVAQRLGFDRLTGTAMVSLGAAAGFTAGILNPFSVGVSQGLADLPLFSGWEYRIAIYLVLLSTGMAYVLWYAKKVLKNPEKSYMHGVTEIQTPAQEEDIPVLTTRHKLVLLTVLAGFGCIIYGTINLGYFVTEIAAVFFGMAMVGGLIGGLGPSTIARSLVDGARTIVFGALVVGLSRGIVVLLTQGKIIDTVVHGLASMVHGLPPAVSAIGMMLVQSVLNFVIPSSSGMAATTMPILVPLGDVIGITRQATVIAFQFGDGITNSIVPTSAALMGYLAVAGIPYDRWVRFVAPLLGLWLVIGACFTAVAVMIHLGPF